MSWVKKKLKSFRKSKSISEGRHWTDEDDEQLIELHDNGYTYTEIANVLKRSKEAVRQRIAYLNSDEESMDSDEESMSSDEFDGKTMKKRSKTMSSDEDLMKNDNQVMKKDEFVGQKKLSVDQRMAKLERGMEGMGQAITNMAHVIDESSKRDAVASDPESAKSMLNLGIIEAIKPFLMPKQPSVDSVVDDKVRGQLDLMIKCMTLGINAAKTGRIGVRELKRMGLKR